MDPNNPGGGGWGQQGGAGGFGQPAQPQQQGGQQGWGNPGNPGAPQGGPSGPAPFAQARAQGYVPDEEEKTHAFYAHLFAGIASFVTCGAFIPIAAAILPLVMTKGRGPFLLFHINQSAIFQTALIAGNMALSVVVTIVSIFTCGIGGILYILCAIPPLVATIMPILVGLKVKEGEWAEYPMVGEKVLNARSPLIK